MSRFSNDGLILIKCSKCGKDIGYFKYQGFSTAICAECQKPPEKLVEELKQLENNTIGAKITSIVEKGVDEIDKALTRIGKRRRV